jgi:cytochrome b6-f complex iron-sulfur subunit
VIISAAEFPAVNALPVAHNEGKFWMVRLEQGVVAHYKVCTHLGCIYKWDDLANHFACPCHGSQFQLNGDWIAGPAPRGAGPDRFPIAICYGNSNKVAESVDGAPVPLPPMRRRSVSIQAEKSWASLTTREALSLAWD